MEEGTFPIPGHTCVTAAAPVQAILAMTGDKWTLLVVVMLDGRTRRFMELKRDIAGISQRMLTRTLRQLERDGLVRRTVYPVVPARVEYQLTALGQSLFEAIKPLGIWSYHYHPEIEKARKAFDLVPELLSA